MLYGGGKTESTKFWRHFPWVALLTHTNTTIRGGINCSHAHNKFIFLNMHQLIYTEDILFSRPIWFLMRTHSQYVNRMNVLCCVDLLFCVYVCLYYIIGRVPPIPLSFFGQNDLRGGTLHFRSGKKSLSSILRLPLRQCAGQPFLTKWNPLRSLLSIIRYSERFEDVWSLEWCGPQSPQFLSLTVSFVWSVIQVWASKVTIVKKNHIYCESKLKFECQFCLSRLSRCRGEGGSTPVPHQHLLNHDWSRFKYSKRLPQ